MEKISTQPKMSKINLNCMSFEIKLSMKGEIFRARSASLLKIENVKNPRPESTSKISYEMAIQNLIPKIEDALEGTNKKFSKISINNDGNVIFFVENIIYENTQEFYQNTNSLNNMIMSFTKLLENLYLRPENMNKIQEVSTILTNQVLSVDKQKEVLETVIDTDTNIITFRNVVIEWQQYLYERTLKPYDDEDYFSPTTLQSYNRYLWSLVFPYLDKYPECDNINIFSEKNVDEILAMTKCKDTQRVLLLSLKQTFEFAVDKSYIKINPIVDKQIKAKNKGKKNINKNSYEFIEEEERAKWINCMIKDFEFKAKYHKKTDASLAFLFTLLHGTRPEETCGVRWIDLNFLQDDFYVQNAYKTNPIFNEITMKRIGWKNEDGPLKTPESYRHIPIDLLIKDLLIEHKKEQQEEFEKNNLKWSENQYVFLNSSRTPFTPKVLSRNFLKFIRRNELPHMVLYGLRHSFATHCRNCGMLPEVLAPLMGHTEYETTQKYYIHISSKQKKDELQKIQQKDIQNYLGNENKDLTHLQNNINQTHKNIENLQEVQKEDMTHYLELNDKTLNILKCFIMQLQGKVPI